MIAHDHGDPLPWVSSVKHLGNTLQCNKTMQVDCSMKRGKFIGKLNSLSQEFHYVQPEIFVKILNIYSTSFYGSSLWDLSSKDVGKFFTSWNVAIRQCFGVPRQTHRYLIEEMSQSLHPQVMMYSRFACFYKSLISSEKFPIRFLARLKERDNRSLLCQNLSKIGNSCGEDYPSKNVVKKKMKYFPIPEDQMWRIPLLRELVECKNGSKELMNFSKVEIEEMLNFACTS